MCGLPASGKSELACSLYPALRFSMDDQRAMMGLTHDRWGREVENVVFDAMLAGALSAVKEGCDVVLDNTHLTPNWPRRYRKELNPFDVEWKVHDLTGVSVEECIARDALRANPVGEAVIRRLAGNLEKSRKDRWRLTEGWLRGPVYPKPLPYVPNLSCPIAYICDIDGTVAINGGHRGHYDYDERVLQDEPNMPVIRTVQTLGAEHTIVFVSGRGDDCRGATEQWLMDHFGFYAVPPLFMRKSGDMRPDYVIKAELFDAHIRDQYNVVGVFDDRRQVFEMWRSIGLTVFAVAEGDF